MEVGTVQEWFLTNSDPDFGHPMHIHVNSFQVCLTIMQNYFTISLQPPAVLPSFEAL